ncbi:hypothetical protein DACRYDRAFT_21301 [Dacryopinax primogenitus]|uniref:CID domain-containing protein n=1 Tax=Dacryopinax primogenitus (strain DJM 731) TaxID=1858805 RepID=M5G6R2_DACPD|nr:uncharacterized protein DACRYDRAFT_21301 [Dacryopinax primogenitus]EJU03895.1 hypothetical protein DACRYDRAFT_21301 [Dacryopinax primogenitus]
MADLQEFEKVLKDVVNAKRLSASRINTLTELCLKLIENDVQLVSLLYRTHKSLPSSQKVFSLYAFDALARAARHAVVKNKITVDPMGTKGNCATFLNKVEGVLDSLISDMLSSGGKEQREKTKKIVDIWTSNNTFSKEVLIGLSAKVKAAEDKATARASIVPQSTTPPGAPVANAAQAAGVQQALLALLSQAAAAKSSTPPATTSAVVPPPAAPTPGLVIDAQRLLQQLAGQVQNQTQLVMPTVPAVMPSAVPAAPSPPPKPLPIYAPNLPPPPDQMAAQRALAVPQMSLTTDNSRFDSRPGGSRPPQWGDARERSPPPRDERDNGRRDDYGEDNRGRGRGRGRGSDRNGWDRRGGRGRDRSPPYGGRERSRSPPYRGPVNNRFDDRRPPPVNDGRIPRRDSPVRNRSPPHYRSPPPRDTGLMAQSMARKDEFGRDTRPGDDRTLNNASEGAQLPRSEFNPVGSKITSTSSPPSSSSVAPIPTVLDVPNRIGLDKFDWSTFNFGSPESWDALGKAFQVTNGHLPSQEEVMTIVMQSQMGGMMGNMMGMQTGGATGPGNDEFSNTATNGQSWQNGDNEGYRGGGRGGRGRGRGRGGRGGYGYGRGGGSGDNAEYGGYQGHQASFDSNYGGGWGNGAQKWNNGDQAWAGDDESNGYVIQPSAPVTVSNQTDEDTSPLMKKQGGQMVKIGDRWQWVPGS